MALDLMSLRAGLFLDDSQYRQGLSDAKGGLSDFAKSAKKVLAAVGFGVAVKKGVDGIVSLTKSAVQAYGQFEQLSGGVETLFKDSADAVKKNAQEAYKTAGLSANEYMKTVTSFSASLIQSTGRGEQKDIAALKKNLDDQYDATKRYWEERIRLTKDSNKKASLRYQMQDELKALKAHNKEAIAEAERTNRSSKSTSASIARAADLADQAVRDMSDNANKFGSDMSSIQNAYAGFSKQNYTMLDNLKLGYGGTKEEMERLLQDAEDIKRKHGEVADYSIDSYADIVEAIHVVQDEMGITGTTAKEAEKTIEGSIASTKAAWTNVLTAIGSGGDMKAATANLIKSARNVLNNVKPVVKRALKGIGGLLEQLAPVVLQEVPKLVLEFAPAIIRGLGRMVSNVAKTLPGAISNAWNNLKGYLLTNGVQKIAWTLNKIMTGGAEQGFTSSAQRLRDRFTKLFSEVFEAVGNVIDIGKSLFDGLVDVWTTVLQPIFQEALSFLLDRVLPVANSALSLINDGLSKIPSIIGDVVNAIKNGDWGRVGSIIWESIKSGFNAVKGWLFKPEAGWGDAGAKIWQSIKDGFAITSDWLKKLLLGEDEWTPEATWADVGKKLWGKIIEGLASAVDWLKNLFDDWTTKLTDGSIDFKSIGSTIGSTIWGAIKDAFNTVIDWFKYLFGGESDEDENSVKGAIYSIDWAGLGTSIFNFIGAAFIGIVDTYKGYFQSAWDAIKEIDWAGLGDAMWGAIKGAFSTISSWFTETFRGPINTVIDYINEMITNFENAFNRVIDGINYLLGTNFERKVFDRVQKIYDTIYGTDAVYGGGGSSVPGSGAGRRKVRGYASGGVLRNGDVGVVGEYRPEFLQVINGKAVVTPLNTGRFPGGGQEVVVPRNESRQLTVILELDRQQMGKMVYKLNNEETQRVGVRLAKGGAY